jgi:hypothetical protein
MEWTVNWFRFRETSWRKRVEDLQDGEREEGLRCYCYKQMALWKELGDNADEVFRKLITTQSEDGGTN